VSVTSEIAISDFNNYDQTALLNAVGTASTMGASKVTIASIEFIVTTVYTFPNGADVNVDTLRISIASANSVTEWQVAVSAQRRLSASERQLSAASFNVEISSSDPVAATAIKTSAQNTSALNTALDSNGITTTAPSATAPEGKVKVVTDVSVPASGSVADVSAGLSSGLATQIDSNIVGASATVTAPVVMTASPTALPAIGTSPTAAPTMDGTNTPPVVPSQGGSSESGALPKSVPAMSALFAALSVCVMPSIGTQ